MVAGAREPAALRAHQRIALCGQHRTSGSSLVVSGSERAEHDIRVTRPSSDAISLPWSTPSSSLRRYFGLCITAQSQTIEEENRSKTIDPTHGKQPKIFVATLVQVAFSVGAMGLCYSSASWISLPALAYILPWTVLGVYDDLGLKPQISRSAPTLLLTCSGPTRFFVPCCPCVTGVLFYLVLFDEDTKESFVK